MSVITPFLFRGILVFETPVKLTTQHIPIGIVLIIINTIRSSLRGQAGTVVIHAIRTADATGRRILGIRWISMMLTRREEKNTG